MSDTQQPEALRIAEWIESDMSCDGDAEIVAELRSQYARIKELEDVADMAIKRIAELEAQLAAIGAGGVEPLRKHVAETSNDILTMVDTPIIKRRIADARDAARYRWLRDNDWNADKDLGPVIRQQLTAIWDVKIDEAMAAQAKQKD